VRYALEEAETGVGLAVNGAIATLILVSATIFVLQTYPLPSQLQASLQLLDWIILGGFTLEYTIRLWAAEHRLRHLVSLYALIDLLAIVPVLVGLFDTRYLRMARWFRILKLARFLREAPWLGTEGVMITRIVFTLAAIIFIYAGAIYQVEHPINPDVFSTFLDAVYFAVVTMTTVGYGDVTPVSEAGRSLTVMMILTGIALIPSQIGSLLYNINQMREKIQIACPGCGLAYHQTDARYCRRCGTQLPKPKQTLPSGG
jgi:voltage-gated potassium channel